MLTGWRIKPLRTLKQMCHGVAMQMAACTQGCDSRMPSYPGEGFWGIGRYLLMPTNAQILNFHIYEKVRSSLAASSKVGYDCGVFS
jgi:hypothetical protein